VRFLGSHNTVSRIIRGDVSRVVNIMADTQSKGGDQSRSETGGAPSAFWDHTDAVLMDAYKKRGECVELPVSEPTAINICGGFHHAYPPLYLPNTPLKGIKGSKDDSSYK
jgi:hypothetical protein